MTSPDRIQHFISQWNQLPEAQTWGTIQRWEALPGDASNRSYVRGWMNSKLTNCMVMILNAPEAFKSEEVSSAPRPTELPFLTLAEAFRRADVRVPQIYGASVSREFVVLEDFGDELLYEQRQKEPAIHWYERALDELIKIQNIRERVTEQSFTRDLLAWEVEHFLEYALEKRRSDVKQGVVAEVRRFLLNIVERLGSLSPVLVHRDFHSKNLMILEKENRVGVIDFQDALWGPVTYDLASLLRDSYVRLSNEEEEGLLRYFETKGGARVDRELFAQTSLQRNLKAVGRFFYISMVKKKDTHLPYVQPTLRRVIQTLKELQELQMMSLFEALFEKELQSGAL